MAYTHCLVVYLDHVPEATRPARRFRIQSLEVPSFEELRESLLLMSCPVDGLHRNIDRARRSRDDPNKLALFTVFICLKKRFCLEMLYLASKSRSGMEEDRPHWKAELLADIDGDVEVLLEAPNRPAEPSPSPLIPRDNDPLAKITEEYFDRWLEVMSIPPYVLIRAS